MSLSQWSFADLWMTVSLILPHIQRLSPEILERRPLLKAALSVAAGLRLGDSVFDTTHVRCFIP
jgi:hypothetical protein